MVCRPQADSDSETHAVSPENQRLGTLVGSPKPPSDPTSSLTHIFEAWKGEFLVPHRENSPLFLPGPFQFSLSLFHDHSICLL